MARALHFVLVCPPIGLSTADVYRHLGALPPPQGPPRAIEPVVKALIAGRSDTLGTCLFNRLQPAAERLPPALVRVRDALAGLGPSLDGHLMSGSGSAYFGLGRDRDAVEQAARRLETLGLGRVRVVTCGTGAVNAS